MAETEAQKLIRRFKSEPSQGSKALALRLKEVQDAFTPEERATHRAKRIPDLPYGRPQMRLLEELLRFEQVAELEVAPCWRALDAGKSFAAVRRAFKSARNRLLQRPSLDFAAELESLLAGEPRPEPGSAARRKPPKKGKKGWNWQNIATVAGADAVTIPQVIARLRRRRWLPKSTDIAAYVSQILSVNTDIFERMERGRYRVIPSVVANLPTAPKTSKALSGPKVVAAKAREVVVSKGLGAGGAGAATTFEEMPRPDPSWRHWVLKRAAQLRVQPSTYLDSLIEGDMQRVLSQARPRLVS